MECSSAAPRERSAGGRTSIDAPQRSEAIAYARSWRIIAAALIVISRGSLLLLLALVVLSHRPILPFMLMRAMALVVIAPGVAAWLIEQACAVLVDVENGHVVLQGRDRRIEIPCGIVAGIEPWKIPLPGSGFTLRLQSGRRLGYGLQLTDPIALMHRLAGACDTISVPVRHPAVVYAHAKDSGRPWRWYHRGFKFVVFGLVPTLPLFRLKQLVTYGGLLGQYYQLGLWPYLQSFAIYWAMLIMYLVLYAAVWRGAAETAALTAAWVAPSHAARVRRAAEVGCRVLYYGGVPALLIRFFFAP